MSQADTETVLVGSVVRLHGLRGEVVVVPESDVDSRFDAGSSLLLRRPDGRVDRRTVRRSAPYKDRLLVGFEGCDDRDAAESLRGCELRVPRGEVPRAPDGEYYFFELLDCMCVDVNEGELGPVVAVIEDGGGLLLEIDGGEQKVLVPFVRSFLHGIDVDSGRIELELPPGLVETCASTS